MRTTPDWQLDMIFESECAQAWEDQQDHPHPLGTCSFDSLNKAWAALETARSYFTQVENLIVNAADNIKDTPEADKLASIYEALSDLRVEVKEIQDTARQAMHEAWKEGRIA